MFISPHRDNTTPSVTTARTSLSTLYILPLPFFNSGLNLSRCVTYGQHSQNPQYSVYSDDAKFNANPSRISYTGVLSATYIAPNERGFELKTSASLGARCMKHLFIVNIFALLKITYYESTLGNHFHYLQCAIQATTDTSSPTSLCYFLSALGRCDFYCCNIAKASWRKRRELSSAPSVPIYHGRRKEKKQESDVQESAL